MFFSQKNLNIKRLYSGGLMVNYVCSSACGHCLYNCSPSWAKEYISPAMAEEIFSKIRECGCSAVHIGGGEPFLNPEQLVQIVNTAEKCKINIEYIETNSSWYKDHDSACKIIRQLLQAGISNLLVSISPFHNEYIPFKKVKGVMAAARDSGMGLFPWIADFAKDIAAFDENSTHSLDEYAGYYGEDYLKQLMRRYSLTMRGRTLKTFRAMLPAKKLSAVLTESSAGCSELSNVSHFHFDLYGNYIPGLCTGLAVDVHDIGRELSDEEYPILHILSKEGIKGFLKYAVEGSGFEPKEDYISKCDICCDIRRFLVNDCEVRSKELQPVEHYSQ